MEVKKRLTTPIQMKWRCKWCFSTIKSLELGIFVLTTGFLTVDEIKIWCSRKLCYQQDCTSFISRKDAKERKGGLLDDGHSKLRTMAYGNLNVYVLALKINTIPRLQTVPLRQGDEERSDGGGG